MTSQLSEDHKGEENRTDTGSASANDQVILSKPVPIKISRQLSGPHFLGQVSTNNNDESIGESVSLQDYCRGHPPRVSFLSDEHNIPDRLRKIRLTTFAEKANPNGTSRYGRFYSKPDLTG